MESKGFSRPANQGAENKTDQSDPTDPSDNRSPKKCKTR